MDPALSRDIVALVRRCHMDPIYEAEEGIFYDLTRPMQNPYVEDSFQRYGELGFDVTASIDAPDFHFDKFCVYPPARQRPGAVHRLCLPPFPDHPPGKQYVGDGEAGLFQRLASAW